MPLAATNGNNYVKMHREKCLRVAKFQWVILTIIQANQSAIQANHCDIDAKRTE